MCIASSYDERRAVCSDFVVSAAVKIGALQLFSGWLQPAVLRGRSAPDANEISVVRQCIDRTVNQNDQE